MINFWQSEQWSLTFIALGGIYYVTSNYDERHVTAFRPIGGAHRI